MKTSVNMIRKIGMFEIEQRTFDGYFEANMLLQQWNRVKQNTPKKIVEFLRNEKTIEFIKQIKKEEGIYNSLIHSRGEKSPTDNQVVIIIKGRRTKKGPTPDRVFMHPYLFVDFAMWLNPKFKYHVIKFVYDSLMDYRNNAGDLYKGLSQSVSTLTNISYARVGKGLNFIVFGEHKKGIRNTGTVEQLQELNDIQKQLAFSIEMGLITSFKELMDTMIKIYRKKQKFNLF
jgi:hypothetical protein